MSDLRLLSDKELFYEILEQQKLLLQDVEVSERYISELLQESMNRNGEIFQEATLEAADFIKNGHSQHDDFLSAEIDKFAQIIREKSTLPQMKAADSLEEILGCNLNEFFIKQTEGESMLGAGINPGDMLLCQKVDTAENGKIIIAAVNGGLFVKRYIRNSQGIYLKSENPKFPIYSIGPADEFKIVGRVIKVMKDPL